MGAAFHAAAPSARVPVAPPTVTSNLDPSGLTVCPWCQRFLGLRAMILIRWIRLMQHPLGLHDPCISF